MKIIKGTSAVNFTAGARIYLRHWVQTGSGVHPASYRMAVHQAGGKMASALPRPLCASFAIDNYGFSIKYTSMQRRLSGAVNWGTRFCAWRKFKWHVANVHSRRIQGIQNWRQNRATANFQPCNMCWLRSPPSSKLKMKAECSCEPLLCINNSR
jgi:hypothetical protein